MNLPSNVWDGKIVAGPKGCHIFTGALSGSGYGHITKNRQTLRAHRLIYEECWGPIPEGLHVLHKCNIRRCVNPLHLYAGTAADNMRDRVAAGQNKGMLGKKLSEETKAKLSKAHLANRSNLLTPEWATKQDKINERRRRRNAEKVQMEPDRGNAGGGES